MVPRQILERKHWRVLRFSRHHQRSEALHHILLMRVAYPHKNLHPGLQDMIGVLLEAHQAGTMAEGLPLRWGTLVVSFTEASKAAPVGTMAEGLPLRWETPVALLPRMLYEELQAIRRYRDRKGSAEGMARPGEVAEGLPLRPILCRCRSLQREDQAAPQRQRHAVDQGRVVLLTGLHRHEAEDQPLLASRPWISPDSLTYPRLILLAIQGQWWTCQATRMSKEGVLRQGAESEYLCSHCRVA